MALDSEAKRWSMLRVANGSYSHLIDPTGSNLDSEIERLTYLGIYGGLTASDVTEPVLSNATGVKTGSTSASGTVDTDEGNGILYYLATQNASELAATIKAGFSQSVTTSGTQNVTITGLSSSTTYYIHYVQDDAANNESNVVSSSSFTTDAEVSAFTGGFIQAFEIALAEREAKEREIEQLEYEAQQIQDSLDRKLAFEFRKQEKEELKLKEYKRIKKLAENHKKEVLELGDRVRKALDRAIQQETFSALEALDREIRKAREEEEFLTKSVWEFYD